MTNRTTAVTLTASATGYLVAFDKASKATRALASDADKLKAKGEAFGQIGRAAMVGGAVVAAGLAIAIVKMGEFEVALSEVQAATQESAGNMALLRDAALEAGAKTAYSATEAANAIEELGKNGLDAAQIIGGGLDSALSLAAASGIAVAEAAQIASITMKQFKLEAADLPHVTDLLAAGAGKAAGDVDQLAQALGQVGLVANGAGLSVEETTGTLAAFADNGLLGSDAGTAFKTMLGSLTPNSDKARTAIDDLNLSAFDSQGAFIGMEAFAGKLSAGLAHLTDEQRATTLETIYGQDAVRAATVVYDLGAKGIGKYIDQTNDAGYAAKVAADRTNNLTGDVEKLGGSFDTALIKSGSGANDVLRNMVQSVTFLVDGLGSLPEPVLAVGLALGVAAAATLLAGGAALVAVPKYAALKVMVADTGVSMGKFALKTAATGGAVALATAAIGFFVGRAVEAKARIDEYGASLDAANRKTTEFTRDLVKTQLAATDLFQGESAFDSAEKLGISLDLVTDAALGNQKAIDEVTKSLVERQKVLLKDQELGGEAKYNYGEQTGAISNLAKAIVGTSGDISEAQRVQKQKSKADEESVSSTGASAEAYSAAAEEVQGLTDNLTELINTINEANGVGQDAVSSNADYRKALEDVDAAIRNIDPATGKAKDATEALARSVDESTVAGAENAAMFGDLAAKSQEAAEAQLALDGSSENYRANIEAGRQTLYDQILALTGNADAAQALTDKIYAIPTAAEFKFIADTAAANAALDVTAGKLQRLKDLYSVAPTKGSGLGVLTKTGNGEGFAKGGFTGAGDPNKIAGPVHLAEFVSTAETTANPANRAALEYMHAGGSMANYGAYATPQYASAGPSSHSSSSVVNRGDLNVNNTFIDTQSPALAATRVEQRLAKKEWGER